MRSPGAVLLIFSSLQGLQIFWSPFIVDSWKEIFFSWVCCAVCAAIWGSWLGQIVNWWAEPEYRVHSTPVYQLGWLLISFTLYHLYQPENLMRRLKPWPHPIISRSVLRTGPCLVLSSHSFSNWIKKLLWRTSGPPLASWKLILLTEMSGTAFYLIIIRYHKAFALIRKMNQQLKLLPRNTKMLTIFCVNRKFPNFEEGSLYIGMWNI